MSKKSILSRVGIATVFSLILSYFMYKVAFIPGDDSFLFWRMYRDNMLYGKTISELCFPIRNIDSILHALALRFFDFGEYAIAIKFAAQSFLCYFFAFLLVQKDKNRMIDLAMVSILFFILLPSDYTNIYHLYSTVITLSLIYIMDNANHLKERKYAFGAMIIFFLIVYFFRADIVLVGATVIIPLGICLLLYLWQNSSTRKFVYLFAGLGACFLLGVRFVLFILGRQGGVSSLSGIYGGSGYTSWATFAQFLTSGISLLGDAINASWNLPDGEDMIALSSAYYIFRYFFLFGIVFILVRKAYEIIIHGIREVGFVDSFITISIWSVVLINIFNQTTINFYLEWGYCRQHNRYLAAVWFLAPVLLCREISKYLSKQTYESRYIQLKRFKIDVMFFVFAGMISLSCIQVVDYPEDWRRRKFDLWADAADWLSEHAYYDGVAFEPTNRYNVDVWTGGKTHTASAIEYLQDGDRAFEEKYRQMNFVLVRTAWEDYCRQVEASDYDYKHEIINHEKNHVEAYIYCYDHDVRYNTEYIDADDRDYYEYIVGLGKTRFTVQGEVIDSECLSFFDDEGNEIETVKQSGNGKLSYEIVSDFSRNIRIFNPFRYQIEVDKVWAARELDEEDFCISNGERRNVLIPLEEGKYYITICGNNLLQLVDNVNDLDMEINKESQGTKRIRYAVSVDSENAELQLLLNNVGKRTAYVEKIYLEEQ